VSLCSTSLHAIVRCRHAHEEIRLSYGAAIALRWKVDRCGTEQAEAGDGGEVSQNSERTLVSTEASSCRNVRGDRLVRLSLPLFPLCGSGGVLV